MLYEIDESCLSVLKTENADWISFFEQLALDRIKCKNIIVAKRNVLSELAKKDCLSSVSRGIYKALENRASERKLLLNSTRKYCRIVADDQGSALLQENQQTIILLSVQEGSRKEFTSKTKMLAENQTDIELYKKMGYYYIVQKKMGNIKIDFEELGGGGSTISNTLRNIIDKRENMCLCIVDSDKKFPSDSCKGTMQKVKDVIEDKEQDYFEVLLLSIHEIENLIPISILEKVVAKFNLNAQGVEFLKFLSMKDTSENCPVFYFDFKKGIPQKNFILDESCDEVQQKKYRKLENYRKYWKIYIDEFGVSLEETTDDTPIVQGICEKVLGMALDVFEEEIESNHDYGKMELEDYLKDIWMDIGEKVFCWGCVGNRIPVTMS